MSSSRKKSPSLFIRFCLWAAAVAIVLLIGGFLVVRSWFNAYLGSAAFREMIGGLTSKQLKARGEFTPFHYSGTAIYSDEFKADGTSAAAFSRMGVDEIRAEINLNGLWNNVWQIDHIDIQRVQVSLGHTAAGDGALENDRGDAMPGDRPAMNRAGFDWLPKRVDLRKVSIREMDFKWGEGTPESGSVNGASLTLTPDGRAWDIICEGGTIMQQGGPDLTIEQARLRYQPPSLFITEGQLRNGATGSIAVSGEVNFEQKVDVQAKLSGLSVTPFLPEDWRAKLKGNIFGDVAVRAKLPMEMPPEIEGSLNLAHGELEALPVLDQIAAFTRTQRFRKISLSTASASFKHTFTRTTVTNFIADSEGLIRVEGQFVIENSSINGSFEVGVTPASLQWLPGSQEKVFTSARGGYLWTTMRVSGPLANPKEDLSPRLLAAATGAAVDTVQGILEQLPKGDLPAAPKKLLDEVLTPLLNQ